MAHSAVYAEDLESGTPGIVGLEGTHGDAGGRSDDQGSGERKQETSPTPEEPKSSAKDLAAMQRRIAELEASERYWAEQAKKGGTAPAEPKKTDEPDELAALLADAGVADDDAAALLDDIGEKGVAALEKRGVVTKAQLAKIIGAVEKRMEAKAAGIADRRVAGAKDQMTAEAKLLKDYPDLADESSPLAKATAEEFAAMVAEDPSLKNSYGALRAAARIAAGRAPKQEGEASLSTRMARIASQSPARGSRAAAASEFDDGDVEITPEAQHLIALGGKYGLTPEIFKKHARRAG